jgi:hypothetical protein
LSESSTNARGIKPMTSPTDFEILKIIRDHYYDSFASFDKNVPTRLSKIYVPIDIELIAEKLGVDSDTIFERLYYYLDKKYSYKNEDGSIAKFFVNSLHTGSAKEKHLINFPLLDSIVSEENSEIVSQDSVIDFAPDWHERILLALFEKRNTPEFYNLFLLAKNESEKDTIRIKSKELQNKKLIDFDPNHISFRSKRDVKLSGQSENAHERRLERYHNELGAKINLKGVEYVKENVLKRQLNASEQFLQRSLSPGRSLSLWQRLKKIARAKTTKIIVAIIVVLIGAFLLYALAWN